MAEEQKLTVNVSPKGYKSIKLKDLDGVAGNYCFIKKTAKYEAPKLVTGQYGDSYMWNVEYLGEEVSIFLKEYDSELFDTIGEVGESIKVSASIKKTKNGKLFTCLTFEKQ